MKLLKTLITIVFVSTLSLSINAKEIKMGKADWDTGYFQAWKYPVSQSALPIFISFAFIDKLNVETKTIVINVFNNFIIILLL